jgi:hypothetical protein
VLANLHQEIISPITSSNQARAGRFPRCNKQSDPADFTGLAFQPCCPSLLELLDYAIEIGIASAKAPREPVPAALGNPLAVSDDLELTGLPGCNNGFNVEALLDEGYETRDLGFVVLSCRAVNDLDLHLSSEPFRFIGLPVCRSYSPPSHR